MSISDLFKFNPGGRKWSPKSSSKPSAKPAKAVPEKPGFFGKKGALSRPELREKLRRDSGKIPGGGGFFGRTEKQKMEKEVFGKKYGSYIDEREYKHAMKGLGKEKFKAKTGKEKIELDRKSRFLKKLGGFK